VSDAREAALLALYEADQRRADPVLDDLGDRARSIVTGVWEARRDLDDEIGRTATAWRVERMPPVDRNLLRIALWELRHRPETPVPVVISEAVRLAKTYSTGRSGGFVNGVLSKLAADASPPE
jgi:transcription antitermination protein NusB